MSKGPEEREISWGEEPMAGDTANAETAAFETELQTALRPLEPPAGFAERVLAAAAAGDREVQAAPRAKVLPFRNWRVAIGSALAACLVGGAFATQELHHQRERQHQRAVANQQFETATRITDQALAHTREQLARAGVFRQE